MEYQFIDAHNGNRHCEKKLSSTNPSFLELSKLPLPLNVNHSFQQNCCPDQPISDYDAPTSIAIKQKNKENENCRNFDSSMNYMSSESPLPFALHNPISTSINSYSVLEKNDPSVADCWQSPDSTSQAHRKSNLETYMQLSSAINILKSLNGGVSEEDYGAFRSSDPTMAACGFNHESYLFHDIETAKSSTTQYDSHQFLISAPSSTNNNIPCSTSPMVHVKLENEYEQNFDNISYQADDGTKASFYANEQYHAECEMIDMIEKSNQQISFPKSYQLQPPPVEETEVQPRHSSYQKPYFVIYYDENTSMPLGQYLLDSNGYVHQSVNAQPEISILPYEQTTELATQPNEISMLNNCDFKLDNIPKLQQKNSRSSNRKRTSSQYPKLSPNNSLNCCNLSAIQKAYGTLTATGEKIRRPPNAFMIFAKERRREILYSNRSLTNKEVSKILGIEWRNLPQESRTHYQLLSEELRHEHQLKYPGYCYSPIEARRQKEERKQKRLDLRNKSSTIVSIGSSIVPTSITTTNT